MRKDEFIYEFIDKCAYISCLGNIAMENYSLKDGNGFYEKVVETFGMYIAQYDELYEIVKQGRCSEEEADTILNMNINWLRQACIKNFILKFQECLDQTEYGKNIDVHKNLLYRNGILKTEITDQDISTLMKEVRAFEEETLALTQI